MESGGWKEVDITSGETQEDVSDDKVCHWCVCIRIYLIFYSGPRHLNSCVTVFMWSSTTGRDVGQEVGFETVSIIDSNHRFPKGIVFYRNMDGRIFGVFTWNLFVTIDMARKVCTSKQSNSCVCINSLSLPLSSLSLSLSLCLCFSLSLLSYSLHALNAFNFCRKMMEFQEPWWGHRGP